MDAAQIIRQAVLSVERLRQEAEANNELSAALHQVKLFQARRFAATYADLMASNDYAEATHFFLTELYSERNYAQRDTQFARIAGALQRFFPAQVVATAVTMAKLHALTEALDLEMAREWVAMEKDKPLDAASFYVEAWRHVARSSDRYQQLRDVLSVGQDLARLTRTNGLRFMLKMMRPAANAAGLSALQKFLESGFDTFSAMARHGDTANAFLTIVKERESEWLSVLFEAALPEAVSSVSFLVARN